MFHLRFIGVSLVFQSRFICVSLGVSSRVSGGEEGNSSGEEGAFGRSDTCVSNFKVKESSGYPQSEFHAAPGKNRT